MWYPRLLAYSTLLLSLFSIPVSAQAPPPAPAVLPGYGLLAFALPTEAQQLGQVTLTGFNSNRPPQITVALDFFVHRLRQPGLIVTPGGGIEVVHCNPQTRWTVLQGINQQHDTAGWCYWEDAQGREIVQAFFRGSSGDVTLIDIPGAVRSEAHDVNNHKQVVGAWMDSGFHCHGFVWNARTRQLTTFDAPFGTTCTVPLVINNQQVVGGLYHAPREEPHGFLYDLRRRTWEIVEPDQADISVVSGLNDTGTAIVFADAFPLGGRTFTYSAATKAFTPLPWPFPFPGPASWQSINNGGQFLGNQAITLVPDDPEAPLTIFRQGVLATPLPPGQRVLRADARAAVAQEQVLTREAVAPPRAALVVTGCPGDGQARPGKVALSWMGCRQ